MTKLFELKIYTADVATNTFIIKEKALITSSTININYRDIFPKSKLVLVYSYNSNKISHIVEKYFGVGIDPDIIADFSLEEKDWDIFSGVYDRGVLKINIDDKKAKHFKRKMKIEKFLYECTD